MEQRILVVDDEKTISNAIAYALKREGFQVDTAANGEEALRKADIFQPKVIILDVMMPKLNGLEVCRKLENRDKMGIILLTAKNDMVDKILGLELGADDYVTKPFDLRELLARVKALVRRLEKAADGHPQSIQAGGLKIILEQREVMVDGQALELTPKEFDLLALLIAHPGRVFTRDELLDLIWSMEYVGGTRTVDIHIQRLRKKLGEANQGLLQTVHGVGYKGIGDIHEGWH